MRGSCAAITHHRSEQPQFRLQGVFATHLHVLLEMDLKLPGVELMQMEVARREGTGAKQVGAQIPAKEANWGENGDWNRQQRMETSHPQADRCNQCSCRSICAMHNPGVYLQTWTSAQSAAISTIKNLCQSPAAPRTTEMPVICRHLAPNT